MGDQRLNRTNKGLIDVKTQRQSYKETDTIQAEGSNTSKYTSDRSEEDCSPLRKNRSDLSPPRRNRKSNDISPPRRGKSQEDYSPPRRNRGRDNSIVRSRRSVDDSSPPRHNRSSDLSPPRKQRSSIRKNNDNSPPRQNRSLEADSSPPRRRQLHTPELNSPKGSNRGEDLSPVTKDKRRASTSVVQRREKDFSSPRRNKTDMSSNSSTEHRRNENLTTAKRSRWDSDSDVPLKMKKTLDGKTAGLQNAKELILETDKFRNQENNLFKNLPAEVSGMNAATVMRDRKTGKVRNLEQEAEERKKAEEKEDENKQQYSKWGKGLKQVEDQNEKLAQELHEMSKPLARYADDEDLERYLKEQEREGDPMLAYIRKKKKKEAVESGKPGTHNLFSIF